MLSGQGEGAAFFFHVAEGLFATQEVAAGDGDFSEVILFDKDCTTITKGMSPSGAAGVAGHTAVVGERKQSLVVVEAILFEDDLPFWLNVEKHGAFLCE